MKKYQLTSGKTLFFMCKNNDIYSICVCECVCGYYKVFDFGVEGSVFGKSSLLFKRVVKSQQI